MNLKNLLPFLLLECTKAVTRAKCTLCDDEPVRNTTSCVYVSTLLNGYSKTSSLCSKVRSSFGQQCCGDWSPPAYEAPTYIGPYDRCDICRGNGRPQAEATVIHFLYMGAGTCPQYYKFGLEGQIPNHLCAVVQFYANNSCKCGVD